MEGERLLKSLKDGKFKNYSQRIQTYLDTCLKQSDNIDDSTKLASFACRLFHSVGVYLCGKQPDNLQIQDVADAALYCFQLVNDKIIELHGFQSVSPLYHIIISLLQNKFHSRAISFAEFLYQHLHKNKCGWNDDNQVATVVNNIYISFWNSAIDAETQNVFNKGSELGLNFRSVALKYLAFDVKLLGSFSDKVGRAIQWYANNAEDKTETKEIAQFLHSMWEVLKNSLSTDVSFDEMMRIFTETLKVWIKYILICPNFKNLLEKFVLFLNEISSYTSASDIFLQNTVKICVEATNFTVKFLSAKGPKGKSVETWYSFLQTSICTFPAESSENAILANFLCIIIEILLEVYKSAHNWNDNQKCLSGVCNLLATDPFLRLQASLLFNKSDWGSHLQDFATLFCSVTNLLKIIRTVLAQSKEDDKVRSILAKAHELIAHISSHEATIETLIYGHLNEFRNLGNEVGNLGIVLFNSSMYTEALPFIQLSCDYFVKSIGNNMPSGTRQQTLEYLWKKHELMASCYLMIKNFDDALNTIVKGLKWDLSKLSTAMKIWIKVKIEAQRSNEQCILQRTISHVVLDCGISFNKEELILLLQAELNGYRTERAYLKDSTYAVVTTLLELATDDFIRACALIEVAFLAWSSGYSRWPLKNTRSAIDCCKEAISLLEKKNSSDDNLEVKLHLSVANFWLYQAQMHDLQQTYQEEVQNSPVDLNEGAAEENYGPKRDEEDKNDRCDIIPAFPNVKLQVEIQTLEPLKNALELWLEISKNNSWNALVSLIQELDLLQVIRTAAEIFINTENIINELKTWNVFCEVARAASCRTSELHALGCLILKFSRLHMLEAAEAVLQESEKLVKDNHDTEHYFQVAKLKFLLSKSEYFLWSEKIDSGLELLCEVLKNPILERSTKSSILINCEAKLLTVSYLLLPPSAYSVNLFGSSGDHNQSPDTESPICLVLNSMKMCIALIKHLNSENGCKSYSDEGLLWFKPALMRILLESSILVGRLYSDIGAPREARCYLREHLAVAQELLLSYRSAEFLIALAHLDLLCDNLEDCRVKLNGLHYMLHISVNPEELNCRTKVNQHKTKISLSCDEITENFLSTRPGRSLKGHVQQLLQMPNINLSPEYKRKQSDLSILKHPISCTCNICDHLAIHSLYLQVQLLEYQCQKTSEQCTDDVTSIHQLLAFLETKWQNNVIAVLPDITRLNACKKVAKLVDKKIIRICDLVLQVKVLNILASLTARKLKYQEALQHIAHALSCLKKIAKYPEHLLPVIYSTVVYQKVIISLQILLAQCKIPNMFNGFWISNSTSVLKNPCVNELADKISKMDITQLVSLPENAIITQTPHSKKVLKPLSSDAKFTGVCRAPHKIFPRSSLKHYASSLSVSKTPKCANWSPLFKDSNSTEEESYSTFDENIPSNSQVQGKSKKIKKKTCSKVKLKLHSNASDNVICNEMTLKLQRQMKKKCIPLYGAIHVDNHTHKCSPVTHFPTNYLSDSKKSNVPLSNMNTDQVLKTSKKKAVSKGTVQQTYKQSDDSEDDKMKSKNNAQNALTSLYLNLTPQWKNKDSLCNEIKSYSHKIKCRKTLKNHGTFDNLAVADSIEIFRTKKSQPKKQTQNKQKTFQIAEVCSKTERRPSRRISEREEARNRSIAQSVSESLCSPLFSANALSEPFYNFNISTNKIEDNVFIEDAETTVEAIYKELQQILLLISHHPPCPLYSNICTLLAVLEGFKCKQKCVTESKDVEKLKAAFYFSEAVAITLRHQALIRIAKAKSKTNKNPELNCFGKEHLNDNTLEDSSKITIFESLRQNVCSFQMQKSEDQTVKDLIRLLPAEWTVVQICAVSSHLSWSSNLLVAPDLLVCRYRKHCHPVMVIMNSNKDNEFNSSFLIEYHKILEESKATMQKKDPKVWWTVRKSLDIRMKELTESMENIWLGCWKGILLGIPEDPQRLLQLKAAAAKIFLQASELGFTCENSDLLQILIDSAIWLTKEQLDTAVCHLWNITSDHPSHKSLSQMLKETSFSDKTEMRHPVILILDKSIQALPWESMPLMRSQAVSRAPSLNLICAQLILYNEVPDCIFKNGVDSHNTFYILNPSSDLKDTQEKFESIFKQEEGWIGVIGRPPTLQEFSSALADHHLFLYCGHGTGREYLAGESIERLKCQAATILMGCSSGKLKIFSNILEPTGVVLQYWLGGSPCVIGNLWDVTDKDIDRFTLALLKTWLPRFNGSDSTQSRIQIGDAVQVAREKCKLPYLIGSAPVIYGLPLHIQK